MFIVVNHSNHVHMASFTKNSQGDVRCVGVTDVEELVSESELGCVTGKHGRVHSRTRQSSNARQKLYEYYGIRVL